MNSFIFILVPFLLYKVCRITDWLECHLLWLKIQPHSDSRPLVAVIFGFLFMSGVQSLGTPSIFSRLDMTGTKFVYVLFKKMLATAMITSKILVTYNEIIFLTFINPVQFSSIWWFRDPGSYLVASSSFMVSAFSGFTLHMVKERLEKAHLAS